MTAQGPLPRALCFFGGAFPRSALYTCGLTERPPAGGGARPAKAGEGGRSLAPRMDQSMALHLDSDRPMKLLHWAYFYKARILEMLKRHDEAIGAFRDALAADPQFGLAASCQGHLHASLGQPALAVRSFLEALRIAPNDAVAWFNLGFVYQQQKQHADAIAAFQNAVRLKPDIDRAWFGMGLSHAALGRHDEAAKALEKAASLQPMNPHAWYSLGMAYHTLRNQDKVRQIIEQLSRFDPKMTQRLMQDTGTKAS